MRSPSKIDLAYIPTPTQTLRFNDCKFLMKRDDLTGTELTGNKVRKLEYLLHQAKSENADYVFTRGGVQSNHARATVIAAAKLGIKTKLFLSGICTINPEGNLFLSNFFGAELKCMRKHEYKDVVNIMRLEKDEFAQNGKNVFIIPEGGSSPLGIWGYIDFVKELHEQVDLRKYSGILSAAGSGGTSAGMLLGASMLGLDHLKIYAVNVLYSVAEISEKIKFLLSGFRDTYGYEKEIDLNNLQVIPRYSIEGYENISREKLELIREFALKNGILFDPAYTGKAFTAYNDLFLKGNSESDVIFLHTGGIFGVFGKRKDYSALFK